MKHLIDQLRCLDLTSLTQLYRSLIKFMHTLQFWELVFTKVGFNLRSEAAKNYLSYAWWILEPLLHMSVFYVVFGVFLARGTEHFVAFLLTGLIPWLWFAKTITNSTESIVLGRHLMTQVNLPKIYFPTVVIFQDISKQIVVFILFLVFLLAYGIEPKPTWIGLLALFPLQMILIAACSFFVAAITPFLPDFRYLVSTGLQLLMLGSGIFYSYEVILPEHQPIFFLNPMATLIKSYREILLHGHWPDWGAIQNIILFSGLALWLMVLMIRRLDHVYPRVVIE